MARPVEPWIVLLAALLAPAAAAGLLRAEAHPETVSAPGGVLHGDVLVSPIEDRTLTAASWLALAQVRPSAFRRTVAFCRSHRHQPLPNCRLVLVASRTATATRISTGGRHAR